MEELSELEREMAELQSWINRLRETLNISQKFSPVGRYNASRQLYFMTSLMDVMQIRKEYIEKEIKG